MSLMPIKVKTEIYGSDYYAFPKDENWHEKFIRRPQFLKEFLTTETEHCYLGVWFKRVDLKKTLLNKICYINAERILGEPKKIAPHYFEEEAERLLRYSLNDFDKDDLKYIKENIS
jgi:hypothetical protein